MSRGCLSYAREMLGITTMVSLWYAWSRPVRVTPRGIVVGMELLPWSRITNVTWDGAQEEAVLRFDFSGAGHFWYGSKLRAMATADQLERLGDIFPPKLRGTLATGPSPGGSA